MMAAKRGKRTQDGRGFKVVLACASLCLFAALSCRAQEGNLDPKTATVDQLIFHAQRYGNTKEKRADKAKAEKELFARGPESLRQLMARIHFENVGIAVLAQNMVLQMDTQAVAQALSEFLGASEPATRKMAAFFLGLHETPEYADRIMPLLADDKAAGAAMRTLGKWRAQSAVTEIIPFLEHEREPRRVAAANALGDIGDPAAVPFLIEALGDPFFTVREAAARVLAKPELKAEPALLEALPGSNGAAQRQIIRLVGQLKSTAAVPALERLLEDPDGAVREDAARSLAAIRGL